MACVPPQRRQVTAVMAAHRAEYQDFRLCMDTAERSLSVRRVAAWWLREQKTLLVNVSTCAANAPGACDYCICCQHCPCDVSFAFVIFVIAVIALGVGLLAIYARLLVPSGVPAQVEAPVLSGPLAALSAVERMTARRALKLWLDARLISEPLCAELMATAKPDLDSSRVTTAVFFLVLAITVMLLESLSSDTLLANVLTPFVRLFDVPAFGKASFTFVITAASMGMRNWLPAPHRHVLEAFRVFLLISFIGSVVLGVVDTGQHAGETARLGRDGARRRDAGSSLWYMTVGLLAASSLGFLGHAAPSFFTSSHLWASTALALLACSGHPYALTSMQIATIGFIANGQLFPRTREHAQAWRWSGLLLLLAAALRAELPIRFVEGASCRISAVHGTPCTQLVVAGWPGALLGMYSLVALVCGVWRDHKPLASIGTAGICVAFGLALWAQHHVTPRYAGLGFCVTYTILLGLATVAVGGWGIRPLLSLPSGSREGVVDVLVLSTLALLLAIVAIGNSDDTHEWASLLDLHDNRQKFVRGGYAYSQRARLLPWTLPILLYYRTLCRHWPSQEMKVRQLHIVRVAAYVAVGCHCMRGLSWSSLLLVLSALTAVLPWLEGRVYGNPRVG